MPNNRRVTALRYRLKSFVWLALLAMFGVALGPSISRALGPVAAAGMHEHPVEMGSHSHMMGGVQAHPAEHSHGPADSSCLLDCCALCAVAASPCTSVATFVPHWLPTEPAAAPPADRSSAKPDERELWSSAAPRGPPPLA
jgi:hypothetical protein